MPTPQQRLYRMPDADLIQRTDAISLCLYRDTDDFATRGIDPADFVALKGDRDQFSNFPTDEELAGLVSAAADAKNAARAAVEAAVAPIRNMAELEYRGQGLYKTFGFKNLADLSDNDFLRAARRIHRTASTVQADLTDRGLTMAQITALKNLIDAFDERLDDVDAAVIERDMKTQQRVGYGNALYTRLADLASVGRSLYERTDEARYNDYVLEQTMGAGTGNGGGSGEPNNPPA